jgi:hypothetical protein
MAKRVFPKGAPTQYRIEQGQDVNLSTDGILNSAAGGHKKAEYKQALNERRVTGPGGGEIVFGLDRPSSEASGYGAKGYTGIASPGSGKLDFVVGRMASARSGDGVSSGTHVDSSMPADAARIYICETTDVDQNFGLVEGVVGNPKGQSAVALKADQVRMIGRGGIKLVTGGGNNVRGYGSKGETNSKGGKLTPAPGIDLIAGNNVQPRKVRGPGGLPEEIQTLQPVAMAYNTRDCFLELSAILDDIMSIVQNTAFYTQRCMIASSTAFGALSAVAPPASLASGIHTIAAASMMTKAVLPMHSARATKQTWEGNYLQHFGYKFIGSRSVRTT